MSVSRAAILERVRQAQRLGRIPESQAIPGSRAGPPACAHDLSRFLAELTALGVQHFVEDSAEAVRARIAALVGASRVLGWHPARLPYGVGKLSSGWADGSSPRDVQAAAEVGVTGCDAAIAETGSLALLSSAEQPRIASLLPPVHVAIVRRSDLRATLGAFLDERAADIARSGCCTFVTGPSRTADIELTLTLGVHGPGKVIVVVGP
jgi:L-lactate dehydrogenase complex protein LldG